MNQKISRRDVLKSGIFSAGVFFLGGCYPDHPKKKKVLIPLPEETQIWEDISDVVDQTLKGGFAFDFSEGMIFLDKAERNGKVYFLDAAGKVIADGEKSYLISKLQLHPHGISLELLGEGKEAAFSPGQSRLFSFDGEEYHIALEGFFPTTEGPEYLFSVNGAYLNVKEGGKNMIHGISIVPSIIQDFSSHPFSDAFFVGKGRFTSCPDAADLHFSGLENVLIVSHDGELAEEEHLNTYDGEQQADAFFRVDGAISQDVFLKKIEKIRVSQEGEGIARRPVTSYHLALKKEDRKKDIFEVSPDFFNQTLEGGFFFDFSDVPLEMRIEKHVLGLGVTFPPGMFSYSFEEPETGKKFILRYMGIDTGKVPSGREGLFYPRNVLFTEVLEEPEVTLFEHNVSQMIQASDGDYHVTLREVYYPPMIATKVPQLSDFIYRFDVEKDGKTRTLEAYLLRHGKPNRAGRLNLDPDLSQFAHGESVFDQKQYRVFISEDKFSSAFDFFDDHQFSGKQEVVEIQNATPEPRHLARYLLANRYNGEVQNHAYFRTAGDFEVRAFKREKPGIFQIIENPFMHHKGQAEMGYLLGIHRIEKIVIQE